MHKSKQLTRLGQISHPSIPRRISHAIGEPSKHEGEDKGDVGRVSCNDTVREDMAASAKHGDASLSDFEVQPVVDDCGDDVAYEGGDEDH